MNIQSLPSPNYDDRPAGGVVDMVLLHYTGMVDAATALQRLTNPQSKVSAHYTIDEDGTIWHHVPEQYRAWHAGIAFWRGDRAINARSIGIELVNPGHEFGYRAFPVPQIDALIDLLTNIRQRHQIPDRHILGHSDVAPNRKQDPGEFFPWARLADAGFGLWDVPTKAIAQPVDYDWRADLIAIGYDPDYPAESLMAFCRHWHPTLCTHQGIAGGPSAAFPHLAHMRGVLTADSF